MNEEPKQRSPHIAARASAAPSKSEPIQPKKSSPSSVTCTICQRLGSAAGQALVGFKGQSLQVTKGEDHLDSYDTSEGMKRFRCRTCGTSIYNQSNLKDYDFRDTPLAIFERDGDGNIKYLEELRPKTNIFCAHQTHHLMDGDVVKYAGHAGQSEKF